MIRFLVTIGEGGDHGWEGDFGKEVRCEIERARSASNLRR